MRTCNIALASVVADRPICGQYVCCYETTRKHNKVRRFNKRHKLIRKQRLQRCRHKNLLCDYAGNIDNKQVNAHEK